MFKKKAGEAGGDDPGYSSNGRPKKAHGKAGQGSRFGGANVGKAKSELKSVEQIRKSRAFEARKKERNARPSKRGKR